jgi:predicted enzyme related to lactoylglutathione lyase
MSPTGRTHGPAWFDISTHDAARARHFYPGTVQLAGEAHRRDQRAGRRPLRPASRIAVFTDLDGNRIGLVSR